MPRITAPTEAAIADAARRLATGETIAFPTETVYGLGAATFNPDALRKVYQLKSRPHDNPLIAHVLDAEQARSLVTGWDDRAATLAERFWPGPLTLILMKGDDVPQEATAGLSTIAVRSPSHPVARSLLEAFGSPISAPSANRSGHVSPTLAEHVAADFAGERDLIILDGGASECGIESTVLDLTTDPPRVLRPGSVTAARISKALDIAVSEPKIRAQESGPGTSPRHYAPRTPVELLTIEEIGQRLSASDAPLGVLAMSDVRVGAPHEVIAMPRDAASYAAQLYDTLRRADRMNARAILIEHPPPGDPQWAAIINRLERAAYRQP